MALILRTSRCAICGNPIGDAPATGLPHFVRNRRDPLFELSDAPLHEECFLNHPLHNLVERRIEEWRSHVQLERPRCVTCGEEIEKGWYNTGFFTDDRSHPLYEFNYLHFHRPHVRLWSRFLELSRLVDEFEHSGAYEGPPILPK
ncbi:hypothetical protein ACLESO_24120 [Pyxidicoccus sp. 3LG]